MRQIILFIITFVIILIDSKASDYNFGVVVNNSNYTIYRSSALGIKGINFLKGHLKKKGLPFPKTIVYMNHHGRTGFVKEEISLQKKYGYTFHHPWGSTKTYLDGEDPRYPRKDVDKDGVLDGDVEDFYRIVDIILDPNNQPVLFHCLGGRHRTGMVNLALRYIQEGNWVHGPKKRKFVFPRMSVVLNPAEREYVEHNVVLFRLSNVKFIRSISKTDRFAELREKYQDLLNEK